MLFKTLMDRLGHEKFIAQVLIIDNHCFNTGHDNSPPPHHQGGDWGSLITTNLATFFPQSVLGLHLNLPAVSDSGW